MAEQKEFNGGEFMDKLGNYMDAVLTEMQNSEAPATENILAETLRHCAEAYQAVGMTEITGLEVMTGIGTPPGEEGGKRG